ncbi:MAG: hypothetical protein PVI30_02615 [Myxococcales bacterium]
MEKQSPGIISLFVVLAGAGCAGGTDGGAQDGAWVEVPAPAGGGNVAGSSGASTGTAASGFTAAEPAAPAGTAGSGSAPVSGGAAGAPAPIPTTTDGAPMVTGDPAAEDPATAGDPGQAAPAPMPVEGGSAAPVIPQVTGDCPAFRSGTITFMGLSGIEIVAGPKAAGPTAPLVFYWHGTGGIAGEFNAMATAVRDGVVAEGGVLVSFQGTTGGDLLSGTFIFGASDFELVDQLVACAVRDHNIDPRRIYATGCSAGGLFSTAMAAERSSYVAAAAPNSGGFTIPVAFEDDYTPALMTVHGAPGVDVVAVDFSVTSATADDAFKSRGGFVINCNHGGTHCGGGSLAGDIWKFFEAHPYGVDPHPWSSLPAGFNSVCEIY